MRVKVTATRPAPLSIRELLTRMVRGQGPLEVVQRRQIPYWQERGWVRDGNRYSGSYQTRYGAFRGSIEQHGNHHFDFFIYDPPDALRRHSHWACFQDRRQGWYLAHMAKRPADVCSGIMTIERLITEAFENR